MEKTLIREYNANVLAWSLKQVEATKDNGGDYYLELLVLDAEKSPRTALPEMKKTICVFLDQEDKENIELFKTEQAEKKPFFLPTVKMSDFEVKTDFAFCHLHQEDRTFKNGTSTKKGEKVKLPNGEIKWTDTVKVSIMSDNRLRVEDPERTAIQITSNKELCFIKPVTVETAVEAESVI